MLCCSFALTGIGGCTDKAEEIAPPVPETEEIPTPPAEAGTEQEPADPADPPDMIFDATLSAVELVEDTVRATTEQRHALLGGEHLVVAAAIFEDVTEGNLRKIFAYTYISYYNGIPVEGGEISGAMIPAAITYKNVSDKYELEKYEEASDGAEFATSIEEFCTTPSGKKIKGLAEKIINYNLESLKERNKDRIANYEKEQESPASGGSVVEIPKGQEGSEAAAYFAVIKQLATMWQGTYMGLDMANIKVDDSDQLIGMVQNYCANHGMTLLLDDMDGLMKKGYIESDGDMPVGFTDGYLIQFTSAKLTKKKLTAEASCWYGNLGAEGGTFTVNKKDGVWVLNEEISGMWIS